jgi:hypothetical protein
MWHEIFSPTSLFYCSGELELRCLHLFGSHFITTTKLTNITILNSATDYAVQHYHLNSPCMNSRPTKLTQQYWTPLVATGRDLQPLLSASRMLHSALLSSGWHFCTVFVSSGFTSRPGNGYAEKLFWAFSPCLQQHAMTTHKIMVRTLLNTLFETH